MSRRSAWLGLLLMAGIAAAAAPSAAPGQELTLVRLKYTVDTSNPDQRNDWNAKDFAHVLENVSALLRRTVSIQASPEPKVLTLEDPALASYPFLFMAGHFGVVLNQAETQWLRRHLTRGGFLLATACCGNPSFVRSFEREMKKVFPEAPLKTLPREHLVYRSLYEIDSVACLSGADSTRPSRNQSLLQGIEYDGHLVVVFSPKALTCGWAQNGNCIPSCERVAPEDARKLAANIVVFALTH